MSIPVKCPDCDKRLNVKDEVAGKKIRCPACSTIFVVPKSDEDDYETYDEEDIQPKRKKRREEQDDDFADLPVSKPRARKTNKKPGKSKSSGSNGLLIGGAIGGGLLVVGFVVLLIAAIGQTQKAVANRANWPTFRHPMGFAQIDMPGTPTLDVSQSNNGAQTYALPLKDYRLSLVAVPLVGPAKVLVATDPKAADLMFNEMEKKAPSQFPGSRLISSRRMMAGKVPGLEMKIQHKGQFSFTRFYLYPETLICAEFVTKYENNNVADRERFFDSLRGPNGELVNGPSQSPAGTPGTPLASPVAPPSLTASRKALKTKLVRQVRGGDPIPPPPPDVARLVKYDAPNGSLSAYVTTIPQDGKKYPAIVWISGGDCNSIDDGFFKPSPPNNDQTAAAFRKLGIVTMYPSLRGGNDNPGFKEGFLGEVDDVLSAADFLSKQNGIDPTRIYLGGHSTGGTLALLVAESNNPFRAIFSFGPVNDIMGYGEDFLFFDRMNSAELEARTPGMWLTTILNKTFVIEGAQSPGNIGALQAMQQLNRNPQVTFLNVRGANHFNILAPATQLIATKIAIDTLGPSTNITLTEGELNLKYAR